MQFPARVVLLVWIFSQQVVSLQHGDVVIEAAGNLVTKPDPGLRLDFGGGHHGNGTGYLGGIHTMRPELVKMQVCDDDSTCGACTQQTACWHGVKTGKLQLDVPAKSAHNRFVAEVWASCSNGKGEWRMHVRSLQNGALNTYVDGDLFKTAAAARKKSISIPIEKDSRIRVEFVRTKTDAEAYGYISLFAQDVDEYVDDCMGVKNCLADLGDGSDSAFLFRNSNTQQLHCITATTTAERNNISDHCVPWNTCLAQEPARKDNLKTILKAALGTSGSLTENENHLGRRRRRKESCMDPAIEDAESWECECIAKLTEDCDDDAETCFRKLFCASSKVCGSWKSENCASEDEDEDEDSLLAKQTASAVVVRRREAGDDRTTGARLDSALHGKCAA